jgi:GTP-binding nuclear protein Ran
MQSIPTFKVILIGDAGVGKTSLVRNIQGEDFDRRYIKTIGCDVSPIRIGKRYQHIVLNAWDLAGDPKFQGLGFGYYAETDVVIVCFDLTSETTLNHCVGWIENAKASNLQDKTFILVGLKSDTINALIKPELVRKTFPNIPYFVISNKTKSGLGDLMSYLQTKLSTTDVNQAKL